MIKEKKSMTPLLITVINIVAVIGSLILIIGTKRSMVSELLELTLNTYVKLSIIPTIICILLNRLMEHTLFRVFVNWINSIYFLIYLSLFFLIRFAQTGI